VTTNSGAVVNATLWSVLVIIAFIEVVVKVNPAGTVYKTVLVPTAAKRFTPSALSMAFLGVVKISFVTPAAAPMSDGFRLLRI
jgi:hypothetical protein